MILKVIAVSKTGFEVLEYAYVTNIQASYSNNVLSSYTVTYKGSASGSTATASIDATKYIVQMFEV